MEEIWKPIDGTGGMYEVSNTGKVRSLNYLGHGKTQELSLTTDKKGYIRVSLYKKTGKRKSERIHRLVAKAFLENPDKKPEVNHIDGDKKNNAVWNLEWATPSENTRHAYKNGLKEKTRAWCREMGRKHGGKSRESAMTPVIATNISSGETIRFSSQHEAAEKTGACQANIYKVLVGERHSAAGFYFSYETRR